MNYDALIVIDMQTLIVNANPYHRDETVVNIDKLITVCRNGNIPVIFVRHDDGPGEPLEKGTDDWQIVKELTPREGEKIFEKNFNSAFRKTGLHEYLEAMGAKNIIVCGMQTEYCIDTSVKVAFEYEYDVTVVRDGVTTLDNGELTGRQICNFYLGKIWDGRFATVKTADEIIADI